MPQTQKTIDLMAAEIFELYRLIAISRSRKPAGQDDLSEAEFLTLDALARIQPLTIGEVQRQIGVVPAQMSRIVRSLEKEVGKGYLESRINPKDRRRIDISLTPSGLQAYEAFRSTRLRSMHAILKALEPDDRVHFMRIMRQLRGQFEKKLAERTKTSG